MDQERLFEKDKLTPEQLVAYEAFANAMTAEQAEAEIRRIAAHPESWFSFKQIMERIGASEAKTDEQAP